MSMHTRILNALQTKLEELLVDNGGWARLVAFEEVKLFSSDFKDFETPAIQIYDTQERAKNVQGRTDNTWDLTVELILKKNSESTADQGLLFDRRLEIKRKIGEDPTLGLQIGVPTSEGRFKHIQYVRGFSDLHILEEHLMARLEFQALFEEPFSTEC